MSRSDREPAEGFRGPRHRRRRRRCRRRRRRRRCRRRRCGGRTEGKNERGAGGKPGTHGARNLEDGWAVVSRAVRSISPLARDGGPAATPSPSGPTACASSFCGAGCPRNRARPRRARRRSALVDSQPPPGLRPSRHHAHRPHTNDDEQSHPHPRLSTDPHRGPHPSTPPRPFCSPLSAVTFIDASSSTPSLRDPDTSDTSLDRTSLRSMRSSLHPCRGTYCRNANSPPTSSTHTTSTRSHPPARSRLCTTLTGSWDNSTNTASTNATRDASSRSFGTEIDNSLPDNSRTGLLSTDADCSERSVPDCDESIIRIPLAPVGATNCPRTDQR
jgi:hypothetical protein